jgi:hypothetical protein
MGLHPEWRLSVRREMRPVSAAVVLSVLSLLYVGPKAWGLVESPAALAALQDKADQARPKDRCFLYAELVSQMTDRASQQFNSGDSVQGSMSLELVQRYAEKIQMGVADDTKKLKGAEALIRRTVFRLKDIMHEASYEDRPVMEATLRQLNELQMRLMMQVFKK